MSISKYSYTLKSNSKVNYEKSDTEGSSTPSSRGSTAASASPMNPPTLTSYDGAASPLSWRPPSIISSPSNGGTPTPTSRNGSVTPIPSPSVVWRKNSLSEVRCLSSLGGNTAASPKITPPVNYESVTTATTLTTAAVVPKPIKGQTAATLTPAFQPPTAAQSVTTMGSVFHAKSGLSSLASPFFPANKSNPSSPASLTAAAGPILSPNKSNTPTPPSTIAAASPSQSPKKLISYAASVGSSPKKPQPTPSIASATTAVMAPPSPLRYIYVVNVPVEYNKDERALGTKLNNIIHQILLLENETRQMRLVIGINKKEGAISINTLRAFSQSFKVDKRVTLISYLWRPVKDDPQAVNYIDIRNSLFYSAQNITLITDAVTLASKLPSGSVKALFLDPDTTLPPWQLTNAQMVWENDPAFHLLSTAYHIFDVANWGPFMNDHDCTLDWNSLCTQLFNMNDYRSKREIGEMIPTLYAFLPDKPASFLDTPENVRKLQRLVQWNYQTLSKIEDSSLEHLRNTYQLLDATMTNNLKKPPDTSFALSMLLQTYNMYFEDIQNDEQRLRRELMKLNRQSGEQILYPSENVMILSLYDKRRGVDLFAGLLKRRQSVTHGDLWGNSITTMTGRGEGEKILANATYTYMGLSSKALRFKCVDFTALSCIRTLLPPRMTQFKENLDVSILPTSYGELIERYHPKWGFEQRWLDQIADLTAEKPESSLQVKMYALHRELYIEKRSPIPKKFKAVLQSFFGSMINTIQQRARVAISIDINTSILRELYLFALRAETYGNTHNSEGMTRFESILSVRDRNLYNVFKALRGVLPFLFAAPVPTGLVIDPQRPGREVLAFWGYGF